MNALASRAALEAALIAAHEALPGALESIAEKRRASAAKFYGHVIEFDVGHQELAELMDAVVVDPITGKRRAKRVVSKTIERAYKACGRVSVDERRHRRRAPISDEQRTVLAEDIAEVREFDWAEVAAAQPRIEAVRALLEDEEGVTGTQLRGLLGIAPATAFELLVAAGYEPRRRSTRAREAA